MTKYKNTVTILLQYHRYLLNTYLSYTHIKNSACPAFQMHEGFLFQFAAAPSTFSAWSIEMIACRGR